jgi:hypothetical protein
MMGFPIGGYFELELNDFGSVYHDGALALNSGRNAFEYIILLRGYSKVHIPYFTCDVLLEPLKRNNIEYTFYHIDEEFLPVSLDISATEAILYTNYFGINQNGVREVTKSFKHVIIDNSQAFFDLPLENTDTFYSPRKFFGIPDGGFAYTSKANRKNNLETDQSSDRMEHLIMRIENGAESGYLAFKENDKKLTDQTIKGMSNITLRLLKNIQFNKVLKTRLDNFKFLHNNLKHLNKLSDVIDLSSYVGPMVYPLWIENAQEIKERLFQNKIYIANYWKSVLDIAPINSVEHGFVEECVFLPIDQRYGEFEMNIILKLVLMR